MRPTSSRTTRKWHAHQAQQPLKKAALQMFSYLAILNKTLSVIKNQIRESIKRENNLKKILFAYEPVWSIGTGKIPKKNDLIKVFVQLIC